MVSAGLGRLCEGQVWGPAFLSLPQRLGAEAGACLDPTVAQSLTSPEHVFRVPDLHCALQSPNSRFQARRSRQLHPPAQSGRGEGETGRGGSGTRLGATGLRAA